VELPRTRKFFINLFAKRCYPEAMATPQPQHHDESETTFRTAVKEGIAQADAGQTIPYEDVRRWLLSWGTENELPPPCA
jgi:predicted transcriptional regulator